MGADRLARPRARPRVAAHLRLRQPRQGDAARGLPAPGGQPARRRRRAGAARADDHALGQRARDRGLRARRRRRAAARSPPGPGCAASPSAATGRAPTSAPPTRRASSASSTGSSPPRSRAYARGLLSSIVAWQRWGFSRFSLAAGFRTFFKGGWRSTGLGRLVHEAALFERGPLRVSMAVLSDGNPSHDYGTATLRGVARAHLRTPGRPAERGRPARPGRRHPAIRPGHPRRARLRDPGQPHRPAPARLLREPGVPAAPRPPATSRACSATCAAAGSACSCSTPTARRGPHARSCAGRERSGRAELVGHLHRPAQPPQHGHARWT